MDHQKAKKKQQLRRRRHVRRTITGTPERPRLTVFRSSKHIYAQLIDDLKGETLASASSMAKAVKGSVNYGGNVKAARVVGQVLAEAAKARGITKAAFDRGHYRYHGRVRALAEAATTAGLVCCTVQPPKAKPEKAAAEVKEKAAKAKPAKGEKQEKPPRQEKPS